MLLLAREGSKSTTGQQIITDLGGRRVRRYALYISETQGQANDHLGDVGHFMGSPNVKRVYPLLHERQLTDFGTYRSWSRKRLISASGFFIDALGLNTAKRGVKIDGMRPDFLIFDDIDALKDSPDMTQKKLDVIRNTILPLGSKNATSLWLQNPMIKGGVFSQIYTGEAGMLMDRVVIGPIPALNNFSYESYFDEDKDRIRYRILTGDPTWDGQDIEVCEHYMNTFGPDAFLRECQHELDKLQGGLFKDIDYRHVAPLEAPHISGSIVYVDPATTNKKGSSCQGIAAAGLDVKKTAYLQYAWEGKMQPREAIRKAIVIAIQIGATVVWIEGNQGGNTWLDLADLIWDELVREELATTDRRGANRVYLNKPRFETDTASKSKPTRHEELHIAYSLGGIVHILGPHEPAETALNRLPLHEPFDLADAIYGVMSKLIQMGRTSDWSRAKRYSDPRNNNQ